MRLFTLLFLLLSVQPLWANCLTATEQALADEVNAYRQSNGLPSIAVSSSLTAVARWHVFDLNNNDPTAQGVGCGFHSWSDQRPAGQPNLWQPVCYTSDHARASGMWNKPREISGGVYDSAGFEILFRCLACEAQAEQALNWWSGSPAHNPVILNQGVWQKFPFLAMGVAIEEQFASVWFGVPLDPAGTMSRCGNGVSEIHAAEFEN